MKADVDGGEVEATPGDPSVSGRSWGGVAEVVETRGASRQAEIEVELGRSVGVAEADAEASSTASRITGKAPARSGAMVQSTGSAPWRRAVHG